MSGPSDYHAITAIFGSANFSECSAFVKDKFTDWKYPLSLHCMNVLSRLPNFRPSIPLVDLKAQRQAISREIETAIARVVERCDFILGEEVSLFESEFAEYCGVPYAIGVASGTDALHLACRALDIGAGDEVIVPAMTFASTAFAVSLTGARPVIVDVREDDALIYPEKSTRFNRPITNFINWVNLSNVRKHDAF